MLKVNLNISKNSICAALINTSFNNREEVIARIPEDTIRSLKKRNLDILLMESATITT